MNDEADSEAVGTDQASANLPPSPTKASDPANTDSPEVPEILGAAKAVVLASSENQAPATVKPDVTPATDHSPVIPVGTIAVVSSASSLMGVKLKRVLGRLAKIEIENYRVFRGHFEIELEHGCNLLVFGENGAGKSSLYNTLQDFLESSERHLDIEVNRHSYNTLPTVVRLSFISPSPSGGTDTVLKSYEWSAATNDARSPEMRSLDRGKGLLDYKSLLRIHLLPPGERDINLFEIFITTLLAHYRNPVSSPSRAFLEEWKQIKSAFAPRRRMPPNLDKWIKEFNAGFEKVVQDTVALASTLLTEFDRELALEVEYRPASYQWQPKTLTPPRLVATPSLRRLQRRDYSQFLNEARLTSLAVALYLAGLKLSPATGCRLLVLDDILIGLDMVNRVKMLDLIHEHFADWQIIILTYSKAWFERLKERVKSPGWSATWKSVTLWEEWCDGDRSPIIRVEGSGDALTMASRHLTRKDYKAAAVYARSALEAACHRACAKASLLVLHVELPKQRKLEHFLNALSARLDELVDGVRRKRALELLARLEQARAFVLNRNAHFDVEEEETLSGEVGAALDAVRQFIAFLDEQAWENREFQSGRTVTPLEGMAAELAAARALAAKSATRLCQESLKLAHEWFWQVYGAKLGVTLPLGEKPSAAKVLAAAKRQALLSPEVQARLDAAKGYLFGCVKADKFDASKFEEAAKLLEEVSTATT